MPLREWLVQTTGPGRSPKINVLYADAEQSAEVQRDRIRGLWTAMRPYINSSVETALVGQQRLLDIASGGLVGLDTEGGGAGIVGSATGSPVSDAAQMLIRWKTEDIVNGRFIQGRTFVAGLSAGQLVGGNVSSTARTQIGIALGAFLQPGAGWVVWHRPKDGAGGSAHGIIGHDIWAELAVLRRRRG